MLRLQVTILGLFGCLEIQVNNVHAELPGAFSGVESIVTDLVSLEQNNWLQEN